MLLGDLIVQHAEPVHSHEMACLSASADFYLEIQQVGGATPGVLHVEVQHRDEGSSSWITAGAFPDTSTTGTTAVSLSSLKAYVRMVISLTSGTQAWRRVFFPTPSWH